jgi:polyphosphate kinase
LQQATGTVLKQQIHFGEILSQELIPELKGQQNNACYIMAICPKALEKEISDYFLSEVLAFLQPVVLNEDTNFFPEQ